MSPRRRHTPLRRLWLLALAGLLTACQGLGAQPLPAQALPVLPALSPTPAPSLPPENLPPAVTATATFGGEGIPPQDPATPDAPNGLAGVDPLRFVLPSAGPAPVSAWRPPLYPTPWAPSPYDHFYFARPIAADKVNWPLAQYRYGGMFIKDVIHTGVDIPAPRGTPVLAAAPGKVIWAGYGLYAMTENPNDPYGLAVAIQHEFGYQGDTLFTIYGHMEAISVTYGMRVNGGDQIGRVGDTGNVTGVHLHFEVRLGNNIFTRSRNPELWMSPPQGWGLLAGRVMDTNGNLLHTQIIQVHNLQTNQYWTVQTYGGGGAANPDPYYQENVVMGDLPAGKYELWINFEDKIIAQEVEIYPGLVTYFTFHGKIGYKLRQPPTPTPNFIPPVTDTPVITLPPR